MRTVEPCLCVRARQPDGRLAVTDSGPQLLEEEGVGNGERGHCRASSRWSTSQVPSLLTVITRGADFSIDIIGFTTLKRVVN